MSRKPKRKPTDPAVIALRAAEERAAKRQAERDPASWGIDTASMTLPENAAVQDVEQGKLKTTRRTDLFDRLHKDGGITLAQLGAVRSLEDDLHTRALEGDRGAGGGGLGSRDLMNIRSMEAGDRITARASRIGWPTLSLLIELLVPRSVVADHPNRWRYVVEIMAGLRDDEAQRKAVIAACVALARAATVVENRAA